MRIQDAELVLIGVSPGDLEQMSQQLKEDVLEIYNAKAALAQGKMPGQK